MSIPRFLRNNFLSFSSISMFLNHLSLILKNLVASATNDYVKTTFTSPIFDSMPSYAQEKYFVTSFSCPSKFSTNYSHCTFCNNSLTCGHPSRNLTPFRSKRTTTPMLENFGPLISLLTRLWK